MNSENERKPATQGNFRRLLIKIFITHIFTLVLFSCLSYPMYCARDDSLEQYEFSCELTQLISGCVLFLRQTDIFPIFAAQGRNRESATSKESIENRKISSILGSNIGQIASSINEGYGDQRLHIS